MKAEDFRSYKRLA